MAAGGGDRRAGVVVRRRQHVWCGVCRAVSAGAGRGGGGRPVSAGRCGPEPPDLSGLPGSPRAPGSPRKRPLRVRRGDALLGTPSRDFIVNVAPGFCFHLVGTACPLASGREGAVSSFQVSRSFEKRARRGAWGGGEWSPGRRAVGSEGCVLPAGRCPCGAGSSSLPAPGFRERRGRGAAIHSFTWERNQLGGCSFLQLRW